MVADPILGLSPTIGTKLASRTGTGDCDLTYDAIER